MNERYEAWKADLCTALRANAPVVAGEALDGSGSFENVGFHVAAADGDDGKRGGVTVGITLTDPNGVGKGKHRQVPGNWRKDDAVDIARDSIAAYLKLRGVV